MGHLAAPQTVVATFTKRRLEKNGILFVLLCRDILFIRHRITYSKGLEEVDAVRLFGDLFLAWQLLVFC